MIVNLTGVWINIGIVGQIFCDWIIREKYKWTMLFTFFHVVFFINIKLVSNQIRKWVHDLVSSIVGGFYPGVPVQPVLIRYNNPLVSY